MITTFTYLVMAALCLKTIIGFRFPWETCSCCGRKIRDHEGRY